MHVSLHFVCKGWLLLASAWGGRFGLVFGALLLASPEKKTNPIFVDVTQEAGLSAFKNIQGSLSKQHIIETMGGGAGLFDYDRDGNLDIVLVRGSTVEQFQKGGSAFCSLFRGDGRGRFKDVTAAVGIQARGWG